ncbi:MAG: LamG domain-containing protein [Candidatus Aminicenantes bacterium]|jgi:hypothetical protein
MNGSAKLALAIIMSVSFALTCSLVFINASAWLTGYSYQYEVNSDATVSDLPISVNDTYGINGDNIWTNNNETMYVYCENSGCATGDIAIGDENNELNWEKSSTRTGNNPESVWSNAYGVWHFDEGSGSAVYDSTSNSNDGTLTNSPVYQTGKFGNSILFDGNDDYIVLPDLSSIFEGAVNYSISAWIRTNYTADKKQLIFGLEDDASGNHEIRFELDSNGYLSLTTYESGYENVIGNVDLTDNNWHYVAVVRESDSTTTLYVDGFSHATGTTKNVTGMEYTTIGVQRFDSGPSFLKYFTGWIDEVRIYDRAITSDEILEQYYNGISNLTSIGQEYASCPSDNTYINKNVKYYNNICNIEDSDATGALIVNASNVIISCDGTIFNGTGTGIGIYNPGFHNITIQNCIIQNYASDIKFDNNLISEVKNSASYYE